MMKISYRLVIIIAVFITCLITANVIAVKIISFGPVILPAAIFVFPLSYIFGDILTEVYGFGVARKVIWLGFFMALMMSLVLYIVQLLPPAADWPNQKAFETILGFVPRIVLASLLAYFAGEFSNSVILSRLKIYTRGKFLWIRTVLSTLVGEGIDTTVFCFVAFYGVLPPPVLWAVVVSNYIFKCSVEILFTPVTYLIVGFLKKREKADVYDYGIIYNPFTFK